MSTKAEWITHECASSALISLPEPDEDYAYAATRLLSFWPIVNSRGATYEKADFDDDLLKTLVGKQVNLKHDKGKVVGSVFEYAISDDGIDVGIRIDREQASIQGLDIEEMRNGSYFSHVSVELTWGEDGGNEFYAYDPGFNIQKRIPANDGRQMGVRRTTANDPFLLQGNRVAERIKPRRFTGVGLVPNPADRTAAVYASTASAEEAMELEDINFEDLDGILLYADDIQSIETGTFSEEAAAKALTPGSNYADPGYRGGTKRYPLDSEEHVRAAARFWGIPKYRASYSPAQRAHISAAISAAKKRFKIGDAAEKAHAVATIGDIKLSAETLETLTAKVGELQTQIESLRAEKETASAEATTKINELASENERLTQELAAANEKIAEFTKEKAAAEREAKLDSMVAELHTIHPATDEEKPALREKAALVCGDDGVIQDAQWHAVKLERELHAKNAEIEALKAAAPAKTEEKKGEQASDFSTEDDAVQKTIPTMEITVEGKKYSYRPGQF